MPLIRIPRTLSAALGLMLFVSCANPYETCACSPPPDEAVVYGRVTDPAGAAVAGSLVRVEIGIPGCGSSPIMEATTGADGRYRILAYSFGGPEPRCEHVFALPPAGSALLASDSLPVAVQFRSARAQPDSVRVDLMLRAP
ncbi:MAG TPA: carboxypeptidase-like regulatory domain-containing protein [Longimicrobium sp.]|nr:carboxypeptidase-like regulatory domain-containing protein [Longimicrobium sp.]